MQIGFDVWLLFHWVPWHIVVHNHIDGHDINTTSNYVRSDQDLYTDEDIVSLHLNTLLVLERSP